MATCDGPIVGGAGLRPGVVFGAAVAPEAITAFDLGNKFFAPLATLMFGVGAVILPTAIVTFGFASAIFSTGL